jgi:RimJ/RimL family protein N-acetyltransferase
VTLRIPILETERLLIREFAESDLDAAYQLFDVDLAEADLGSEGAGTREERRRWLAWSALNYEQLARLYQPPYGDRAIVLKQTGDLVGSCGLVPCLAPFSQIPTFGATGATPGTGSSAGPRSPLGSERGKPVIPARSTPEVGLFYAITSSHRRHGHATEAARALIDYAFTTLNLRRIIATTSHDNAGSMAVMRKLGMRLDRNPYPEPHWLQVVGVLDNGSPEGTP